MKCVKSVLDFKVVWLETIKLFQNNYSMISYFNIRNNLFYYKGKNDEINNF